MSLKAFHIAFIVVSIVLSLVVTVWGVREYLAASSGSALLVALVAAVGGVALVVYGNRFFKKLRDLP